MSEPFIDLCFSAVGWALGAFNLPPGVADPVQDTGGAGLVGAVGNLMAAAFQTAGVFAQAKLLQDFQPVLEKIAGLLFLGAVMGGIATAAIHGTYRKGLYFLIGPALFYFAVTVRTNVAGTTLKFGNREIKGSIQDQIKFLKTYVNRQTYNGQANVSLLFAGYDALVSDVVEGIVSVIIDTDNQDDIVFRGRERVFSWVIHAMPNEGAFVKLLAYGSHGQCARAMSHAVAAHRNAIIRNGRITGYNAQGLVDIAEYNRQKVIRFPLDPQTIVFLRANPRTQNLWRAENPNCEEIWRETGRVARELAAVMLTVETFAEGGSYDRTLRWDLILRHVRTALQGGTSPGRTANGQAVTAEDVLAAYIIRNTLSHNPLDRFTQEVFTRAPFQPERAQNILGRLGESESYGAYMKITYFAGMIPYIQGIVLYTLALLFPFFAIFLVMPSRASSFVVWFALWAWVKSWDIGFAMVDVARQMLWQFIGNGTNAFRQTIDWNRPETIFTLIFYNDPIVTNNTYLQLTAFLTCSVPIVTGHFCLGAANVLDFMKLTIDQNAKNFAQARSSDVRRALIASPIERMRDERRHNAQVRGGLRAGFGYLVSATRNWITRGTFTADLADLPANVRNVVGQGANMPAPGGDYSLQRVMAIGFQVAGQDYNFSPEGQRLGAWLAVSTSRLSYAPLSYTGGSDYLRAYAHQLNFDFVGVGPGGGTQHWMGAGQSPLGQWAWFFEAMRVNSPDG